MVAVDVTTDVLKPALSRVSPLVPVPISGACDAFGERVDLVLDWLSCFYRDLAQRCQAIGRLLTSF